MLRPRDKGHQQPQEEYVVDAQAAEEEAPEGARSPDARGAVVLGEVAVEAAARLQGGEDIEAWEGPAQWTSGHPCDRQRQWKTWDRALGGVRPV